MSPAAPSQPSPLLAGVLVIAAVGLGIGTALMVHRFPVDSIAGASVAGTTALLCAGWLAVGGGLDAWRRHPDDPFGPVLVAAGLAWFATEWANPGNGSAVVFTLGLLLSASCPPLVVHAAFLRTTRPPRLLMDHLTLWLTYVSGFVLLGLGAALFFDPATNGCNFCPQNLLLWTSRPDLVGELSRSGAIIGLVGMVLAVASLLWHLARASTAARSAKAPVTLPAAAFAAVTAVLYGTSLSSDSPGLGPSSRNLWFAGAAALAATGLGAMSERVRVRRARRVLAELVVELDGVAAGDLSQSLASALGDPDLKIAYPTGDGVYVDASGIAASPTPGAGQASTALVREGEPIAFLIHRADLLGEPGLVEEVAAGSRLGLEYERLRATARAQLSELRRSRLRIVEAGDAERIRLERDLHDGTQQSLVGLSLAVRLLRLRLDGDSEEVATTLEKAERELHGAIDDLRSLARGVHPAILTDEGLAAAVYSLAEESPLIVALDGVDERRLPAAVETAAYHLIAETAKTGPVRVTLAADDELLSVELAATQLPDRLVDLEDRVGALDGSVALENQVDGTFRLRADIPCV